MSKKLFYLKCHNFSDYQIFTPQATFCINQYSFIINTYFFFLFRSLNHFLKINRNKFWIIYRWKYVNTWLILYFRKFSYLFWSIWKSRTEWNMLPSYKILTFWDYICLYFYQIKSTRNVILYVKKTIFMYNTMYTLKFLIRKSLMWKLIKAVCKLNFNHKAFIFFFYIYLL